MPVFSGALSFKSNVVPDIVDLPVPNIIKKLKILKNLILSK